MRTSTSQPVRLLGHSLLAITDITVEDSFILLDALEADAAALRELRATLCVEIG